MSPNSSLRQEQDVNFVFLFSFDPFTKKRTGPKDKLEMGKLLHKMKRERKGAKKDIRADAAFIANHKAKERRERYDKQCALTVDSSLIDVSFPGTRRGCARPRSCCQAWEIRRAISGRCSSRRTRERGRSDDENNDIIVCLPAWKMHSFAHQSLELSFVIRRID